MKKRVAVSFYAGLLLVFGLGIGLVLQAGEKIERHPVERQAVSFLDKLSHQIDDLIESKPEAPLSHKAGLLLLQIAVIFAASKITGKIFQKFHQPAVMGEIAAGIFLGPTLLGWLAPGISANLFPAESLPHLKALSLAGILLYMFMMGMELDLQVIKKKAHATLVISHAGIIIPFFLGTALSLFLYKSFAPPEVRFSAFALFMGIAMSITAFPVLARILEEKKLSETPIGMTALTCAAIDDVTAWTILAAVVAAATSQTLNHFFWLIPLLGGFIFLMLYPLRRFLKRWNETNPPAWQMITAMFVIFGLSAFFTERIGIHALFGAFLAGVICPDSEKPRHFFEDKIGKISRVLLPVYFAFSGLRTQIGLIKDGHAWLMCFIIIIVAIFGKWGGSTLAARIAKMNWRDSLSVGVLMNTRGLMQLIVLNIGYDLGILSAPIFAMMVIMALVTTLMTSPLLQKLQPSRL